MKALKINAETRKTKGPKGNGEGNGKGGKKEVEKEKESYVGFTAPRKDVVLDKNAPTNMKGSKVAKE